MRTPFDGRLEESGEAAQAGLGPAVGINGGVVAAHLVLDVPALADPMRVIGTLLNSAGENHAHR